MHKFAIFGALLFAGFWADSSFRLDSALASVPVLECEAAFSGEAGASEQGKDSFKGRADYAALRASLDALLTEAREVVPAEDVAVFGRLYERLIDESLRVGAFTRIDPARILSIEVPEFLPDLHQIASELPREQRPDELNRLLNLSNPTYGEYLTAAKWSVAIHTRSLFPFSSSSAFIFSDGVRSLLFLHRATPRVLEVEDFIRLKPLLAHFMGIVSEEVAFDGNKDKTSQWFFMIHDLEHARLEADQDLKLLFPGIALNPAKSPEFEITSVADWQRIVNLLRERVTLARDFLKWRSQVTRPGSIEEKFITLIWYWLGRERPAEYRREAIFKTIRDWYLHPEDRAIQDLVNAVAQSNDLGESMGIAAEIRKDSERIKRELFTALQRLARFSANGEHPSRIAESRAENGVWLAWNEHPHQYFLKFDSRFHRHRAPVYIGQSKAPYYVLERLGNSWRPFFNYEGNNLGDARWFLMYMGEPASHFFRFKMLEENRLQVPGAEAWNESIDYFNYDLPIDLQISARYFSTANMKYDGLGYLRKFVDEGALPLANDGFYLIHDTAFHLSMMLLPRPVFETLRGQLRAHLQFLEFLQDVHPELSKRQSRRLQELTEKRVLDVDRVANITIPLTAAFAPQEEFRDDVSDWMTVFSDSLQGLQAPGVVLRSLVKRYTVNASALDQAYVDVALDAFLRRHPEHSAAPDHRVSNPDALRRAVEARLAFIQERATYLTRPER